MNIFFFKDDMSTCFEYIKSEDDDDDDDEEKEKKEKHARCNLDVCPELMSRFPDFDPSWI